MKKIIPFTKELFFKTRIAEVTDIEITHNLERTPQNTIDGSFLVNGTYKMTERSEVEEKFSYDLPFTIEVDEKYDLENVKIKISDFFFEIINEDTLKVNVEVELSDVNLRKEAKVEDRIEELEEEEIVTEERCYDEEQEEIKEKEVEIETEPKQTQPIDILDMEIAKELEIPPTKAPSKASMEKENQPSITDIFTSVSNHEDTFKSYYVYIVRENDTLDSILSKYGATKEEVAKYNDLDDIKIGTKMILPCSKNE